MDCFTDKSDSDHGICTDKSDSDHGITYLASIDVDCYNLVAAPLKQAKKISANMVLLHRDSGVSSSMSVEVVVLHECTTLDSRGEALTGLND